MDNASDTKTSVKKPSVPQQPKPHEEKMNLHSFIHVKGYSVSIEHRMQHQTNDDKSEKTLHEWEDIYSKAMNRKTN